MRPGPRSTRFSPSVAGPRGWPVCLAVCLGLAACGDGKPRPNASKIAAAFENQVDPKANAKQAADDMRKLKEKVAAEAEAAVLAEIDAITVPASDAPGDIKKACEGMRAAHDGFVQKRLAGNQTELDRWNVMKAVDLEKVVEACVAGNQPKVASCQHNALASASPQIGRDRVETLAATCVRKYGQPLAAAPGKPGKTAG